MTLPSDGQFASDWINIRRDPYLLRYRSPRFSPLRTTDAAMGFVRNLITTDPVTSMTVINNNVNAPQFGTQQCDR